MPCVLLLTEISCDEEAPPHHKAKTQTWTNVSAAQHVMIQQAHKHTAAQPWGSLPAPGLL